MGYLLIVYGILEKARINKKTLWFQWVVFGSSKKVPIKKKVQ